MKEKLALLLSPCIFFFVCYAALSMDEYRTEDEEAKAYNVIRTTKTVQGLHFNVEEDRPIAKVAGVYRPLDIDSYIVLKFNTLDKKFNDITSKIEQRLDELSQKLEALSKKVDELSQEKNPPAQNQTVSSP